MKSFSDFGFYRMYIVTLQIKKKKKKRITYYSVKLQKCFFLFDPLSSKDLAGLFLFADCLLMR